MPLPAPLQGYLRVLLDSSLDIIPLFLLALLVGALIEEFVSERFIARFLTGRNPGTMLHMILDGARIAATAGNPTGLAMPSFGWKLSDQDIADLASYLRGAWGNRAAAVSAADVKKTRERVADAAAGR